MTIGSLQAALASMDGTAPITDLWSANAQVPGMEREETVCVVVWYPAGVRAVFDPRVPESDRVPLFEQAAAWWRNATER